MSSSVRSISTTWVTPPRRRSVPRGRGGPPAPRVAPNAKAFAMSCRGGSRRQPAPGQSCPTRTTAGGIRGGGNCVEIACPVVDTPVPRRRLRRHSAPRRRPAAPFGQDRDIGQVDQPPRSVQVMSARAGLYTRRCRGCPRPGRRGGGHQDRIGGAFARPQVAAPVAVARSQGGGVDGQGPAPRRPTRSPVRPTRG